MAIVKFTSTKLQNINKQGKLKKDQDGYYEIVIGGLNIANSSGIVYVLDGAKKLFEDSSALQRRIKNGSLYGESGHPIKPSNMGMDDYIVRVLTIDNNNVCCHFKEIYLDDSNSFNNNGTTKNTVAIIAKLKPFGPRGAALEESLNNPNINTAFSIRSLSEDFYRNGVTMRTITEIVTWDWVIEPGISIATKWDTPSLEDFKDSIIKADTTDLKRLSKTSMVSNEDSRLLLNNIIAIMDNKTKEPIKHIKPIYLK